MAPRSKASAKKQIIDQVVEVHGSDGGGTQQGSPAPIPKEEGPETTAMTVQTESDLQQNLEMITVNTKLMEEFIKSNLVQDIDYGQADERSKKETLLKSGSEKVCLLLNLVPVFSRDEDTLSSLSPTVREETVAFVCRLTDRKNGNIVAEGRGACNIHKPARGGSKGDIDVNRAVKMAEKRAQMDAVLRVAALSGRFAQDLEDAEYQQPAVAQPAPAPVEDPRDRLRRQVHAVWNKYAQLKGWTDAAVIEKNRHIAMGILFKARPTPVEHLSELNGPELQKFVQEIQAWTKTENEKIEREKEEAAKIKELEKEYVNEETVAEAAAEVFAAPEAAAQPAPAATQPSPVAGAKKTIAPDVLEGYQDWIEKTDSLDELETIWKEEICPAVKGTAHFFTMHSKFYLVQRAKLKL